VSGIFLLLYLRPFFGNFPEFGGFRDITLHIAAGRADIIIQGRYGDHGDGDTVASEGTAFGRDVDAMINPVRSAFRTLAVFHFGPPLMGAFYKAVSILRIANAV
jgi:hypothetical protein